MRSSEDTVCNISWTVVFQVATCIWLWWLVWRQQYISCSDIQYLCSLQSELHSWAFGSSVSCQPWLRLQPSVCTGIAVLSWKWFGTSVHWLLFYIISV